MHFSDLKQALLNRGEFWEDAVEKAALHISEVQKVFVFCFYIYIGMYLRMSKHNLVLSIYGYVGKNKY